MKYFLGLDAGGTKTRAVIIDENSKIMGEGFGGPANYHNIGLPQVNKNVYRTIEEVLSKAFLKEEQITWVTVGIAACDTPHDHERLLTSFTTAEMKTFSGKLTVVNDTKIGLYSGTLPPGIVVVCGTGCNVYGENAHGDEAWAGNWGPFLGDRGSGYHLAKKLFETVVAAYDGTGEQTALTKKLEERLHVTSPIDILDWYNDTKPSIHEISDFAPLVLETAEEGDEVARQLVDLNLTELGHALAAVVRKLKMEEDANRVVIVGGLFESKYFRALFEGHVTALLKRVRIVKPLVSAAVGAAIMARAEFEKSHQPSVNSLQQGKLKSDS